MTQWQKWFMGLVAGLLIAGSTATASAFVTMQSQMAVIQSGQVEHERRIVGLETANANVQWNLARICERLAVEGCR
jgi:hypothetical protein